MSATRPVESDTRRSDGLFANGGWHFNHWRKQSRSRQSLVCLAVVSSLCFLCCSELAAWIPVNFSRVLHIGTHNGIASTYLTNVLSVIPRPRVDPPDVLSDLISTCSMVISDQIPDQNLSVRRMVKKPFCVNKLKYFADIFVGSSLICCRYKCADLA